MSWQVRLAERAEVPRLPDVERAAARLFPAGRIPEPDETHSVEELLEYLSRGLLWVAADEHEPLGYVYAGELDGALHVYELAVDPAHGRRGLGTALMRRAMAEAPARRLDRVTLTTFEDLPWNAPFYERLGFRTLAPNELSASLATILEHERAVGMIRRVAMRYSVPVRT
ncbi:MAG TPA: GNAT family N-acetyltransferase [Pseudomonadales bacterium]